MNNLSEKALSCCRFGANCAFIAGASYLCIVILTLMIPNSITTYSGNSDFFKTFDSIKVLYLSLKSITIIANLAMIGVISTFFTLSRDENYGMLSWVSILGIMGYLVGLIQCIEDISLIPYLADQYKIGNQYIQEIIVLFGISNPKMYLLSFGLPGMWFITVSLKGDTNKHIPKVLIFLGVLWGIGNIITAFSYAFNIHELIYLVAIGALICAPLWGIFEAVFLMDLIRLNERRKDKLNHR